MARGMILCRWDDRLGVVLEAKYPANIAESLADDDLLTIFSTHAISEKAGVMAMRIKRVNIISYYSGLPEGEKTDQFVVALILEPEEDPSPYEEGLAEISKMVIPAVGKPGFEEFFAESFDRISKYVSINEEQRYSFIFRDNTRRLLLERLANGPMTKEGLAKWLSKEIGQEVTDIEGLLQPLRKTDLIEEVNISKGKKVNLEFVFLIRDVAVIRTPHVTLFKAAKEGQMATDLRDKYIDDVSRFFKEYRITGQDCLIIANAISDPDQYDIIRLLRKEYVTRAELPAKLGREIPTLDKILKKMAETHIVTAIKDKKERVWVVLLSDIVFPQFFPEYMIDVIRRRWKEGTIQKEIALKHLELLRAEYIATQAPKFRKKMLESIYTNFASAEKLVRKSSWDQASTVLDQVANLTRDIGERKVGEMIDGTAKGIREDKEKYAEQTWEQERVKILEALKEVEERDKAKELAKKEEGKKEKKKPVKKKTSKKKTGKGEEEEEKTEEEAPTEAEAKDAKDMGAVYSPGAAASSPAPSPAKLSTPFGSPSAPSAPKGLTPPPKGPPSLSPPTAPIMAPPQASVPEAPAATPVSGDPQARIAELKTKIKELAKSEDTSQIADVVNQLADAYDQAGDKANAEKMRKKAHELAVTGMQDMEKQLETDAKAHAKKKSFAEAAKCYDEMYQIANQLFKSGMMEYAEKAKRYQKLKSEMEEKQG